MKWIIILVLPFYTCSSFGQQFTKTLLENYPQNFGQAYVASWGDFNNDNYLDIFTNRLYKDYLVLYMNNGDGTFRVDSSVAVQEVIQSRLRFGALADYDNDCDLDIFGGKASPTNDSIFLYQNKMNSFHKIAFEAHFEDDYFGAGNWIDYNNDGYLDLYAIRGGYDKNVLYHNNGNGTFSRITDHALVNECCATSFHSTWADYDNDGDTDVFVVNSGGIHNFLFQNDGKGNFTRITQGAIVESGGLPNGASWGDYNNDGLLDLFVTNNSEYGKPGSNFLSTQV